MPKFLVTSPGGRKFEVNAPEGATQADAIAYIQGNLKPSKPEYETEGPSGMARVGRGIMDVGQGAKQVLLQRAEAGRDSPYARRAQALQQKAGVQPGSGPTAAGYTEQVNNELELYDKGRATQGGGLDLARIGGNVVATAPVGLTSVLPRAMAARIGIGAGQGAAIGGAQFTPSGTGTERLANAATGAAFGGAVPVAGKVLKSTLMGMKPATEKAAQYLKDKIPLTPGMLKGGLVQKVEEKLASVPIIGGGIRARQNEALSAWNQKLLNEASPGPAITAAGQEGQRQLQAAFKDAYGKIWQKTIKLKDGTEVLGTEIETAHKELPKLAQAAFRRGDVDEANAINAQHATLMGRLPDEVAAELARVDAAFAQFARLRRAGSYMGGGAQGQPFTPRQLLQASTALDRSAGKGNTARGQATMQPQATEAAEVLGNVRDSSLGNAVGAGLLGGAAFLQPHVLTAAAAGRGVYSRPVTRYLTGQTAAQKEIAKLLEDPQVMKLVDGLRRQAAAAAASAGEGD